MAKWSDTTYDQNTKFTTPLPNKKFLASFPKDIKILDAGCGYGRVLRYLSDIGFKNIAGFDVSSDYIAQAKKTCPEAEVSVSSFEDFSPKDKYDLVLLMGVIEYILTDKAQSIFFDKISKSLSQNGHVLLETFTIDFKSGWKQYLLGVIRTLHFGRFKNSKGFECHHQSCTLLKKILQKYFSIEHDEKKDYQTWTGNIYHGYYFILRKK